MNYNRTAVEDFISRARALESDWFMAFYVAIRGEAQLSDDGQRVNTPLALELAATLTTLGPWERANIIDGMGQHMVALMREDFRRLVEVAREADRREEGAK